MISCCVSDSVCEKLLNGSVTPDDFIHELIDKASWDPAADRQQMIKSVQEC